MALEGTIKDFGLPDIFQLIGLQRKTGLLTLKSEKEHITVVFESGMVVGADSANKRVEDRLGNVLVKQGKLSKEKLDEALATQKATLQRLGHILVTHNHISAQDLKEAITVQISSLVFKVFRWRDGEYHFAPSDSVEWDKENFSPMSADFILMEGIRMVDEWPIIEKKIPSLDIVFKHAVEASQIDSGDGGDESDDMFAGLGGGEDKGKKSAASSKIRLSAEEERIFRKVDGTRTVQGIIDASGMGDFDTCRVLFDLLNRNIITQAGKGQAARAVESGPALAASPVPGYIGLAAGAVLALASLTLHAASPFGVLGTKPVLRPTYDAIREDISRSRMDRIDRAVQAHRLVKGALPGALDEVVAAGLLDRTYLADPWSRPYEYLLTEDGYNISAVDGGGQKVAVVTRRIAAAR